MAISVEDHKFLPPRVFHAPAVGFPLEFYNSSGALKSRLMLLLESQKKAMICAKIVHSFRQYWQWTNKQADGTGKTVSHSTSVACWSAIKIEGLRERTEYVPQL